MELSLDTNNATYQIQSYKDGCITVNGQKYSEAILIMPDHLITPWGPTTLDSLSPDHFNDLLQFKPELVILGTGSLLQFPPKQLYAVLTENRIGVEIMNTRSACRTYTLLTSENRRVVAGLLV